MSEEVNIFNIYTAIDILDEKCVRLKQGDFGVSTTYNNDPVFVAKRWKSVGAKYLHVVDLDGARTGLRSSFGIIEKIIEATGLKVQVGGGVRSLDTVDRYMTSGADRVVFGSAAVKDPGVINKALDKYGPEKIVIALDCKHNHVAIEGWLEESKLTPKQVIDKFIDNGLKYVLYTDIDRDGMLSGPNIEALSDLAANNKVSVIASGGVSKISDVLALKALKKEGLNIDGVIIGKALYDNKIHPKDLYKDQIYY
jgi:phosphoribosylformimino-5-aminoimidazole carboxamide ribotide isomerase